MGYNMSNTVNEQMITLHLPLSQVNIVLAGLGELPLKVSRTVSSVIEQQANADIQRQQEFLGRRASNAAEQPTQPAMDGVPVEGSKGPGAREG